MSQTTIERVIEQLQALPERQQQQVLVYARSLRAEASLGIPGSSLLEFAGAISREELEVMERAIEDGCERVDLDEW